MKTGSLVCLTLLPLLSACAGAASTVPAAEVRRLYPPGSLHAPIQGDPERAGPGGTINPETGVANRQSGGF